MNLSLRIQNAKPEEFKEFLELVEYDKDTFLEQVQAQSTYPEFKKDKIRDLIADSFPSQMNPELEDYAHARIDCTTQYEENEFDYAIEYLTTSNSTFHFSWEK